MTPQQFEETLVKLTQQVATLHTDNESLRADNQSLRTGNHSLLREHNALITQYLALSQSINTLVAERDALKQKAVELEAVNKKLTDMLWGRRSERRVGTSISPCSILETIHRAMQRPLRPLCLQRLLWPSKLSREPTYATNG